MVQFQDTKFIMYELEAETMWLMINSYQISFLLHLRGVYRDLIQCCKEAISSFFFAEVLFGQS